jgi:hypothetical protein
MLNPVMFVEDSTQARFTKLRETAVAVRFVGAAGIDVTVIEAVPLKPPLEPRAVAVPIPELGAVYMPVPLIEPMPPASIDQVNPG